MKKPKYILLSIPVLFAIALSSCGEELDDPCTPSNSYFTITPEARAKTPYFDNPDFDTIYFASDKGDTAVFVLLNIDTSWYCEDIQQKPNGCPINQCYQVLTGKYLSVKGHYSFSVKHAKKLNLFVNIIDIQLNTYHYLFGDNQLGSKNYIHYVGDYYVGSRLYFDALYEFEYNKPSSSAKGFYSSSHGLLSIDDTTHQINWVLIKP